MDDTRILVRELPLGVRCATRVLISDKASGKLSKFQRKKDPNRIFLKTLKRVAKDGFGSFEGDGRVVRPEGDGVFAIGVADSLFRLAGFHPRDRKTEFIVIDAYEKPGQSRGRRGDAVCKEVARIKKNDDWRENVVTPRLVR